MARIFLVIHLCFRASLCNATLQLRPGRGGIYFLIPWILSGLLTCFGNKIQQNQQRTSLRMFPHSPWEPSGWGLVNEPGLAGWMTGHVETGRHHRIRQQSVRQVEEAVLEQPAPADHCRHLSTPAKTSEAWPMGSSVRNHTCGRNMYCFRPSVSGRFYPVIDDWQTTVLILFIWEVLIYLFLSIAWATFIIQTLLCD